MTIERFIAGCWILFILYWIISAQSVKPIQSTSGWLRGNWYQLLLALGWLLIFNPLGLARLNPLAFQILPAMPIINLAAALFVLAGLIIAILARRGLADNWSREVAIKQDHELITTGLYRYVRNPIYSGILLMTLGTALSFGTLSACVGLLIVLLGIYLKLHDEESILTEHFGSQYESYRKQTKALIPFVW